ncbi:SDR family NAD(P)-dependent oxidoreductase [Planctomyces sp. SH-PL62]|uniref:SDR family NAD(P)-dependent oxidoreductase n=1 Tax=Planctomyces sp. SH-PL62 TaxID=1636152 RepID=UPI00078EEA12|nr:SDR family oxidoreductase [Planctomyces sp. SH-PL62]AMV38335.1 7-alpha-hydroxysteroid dehydrogenase [Planctomyces sp. SH-PL62]
MSEVQSDSSLRGLRCAVIGATSGIGRATALALAHAGADVIVHGRNLEAAVRVVREIEGRGTRVASILADLRSREQGDRLVANAWKLWDGLDAWLHFAGADVLTGEGPDLSFEAKLDLLWEVDVVAAIRLCRDVGRRMADAGGGAIVTMGWDQAETGMEGDSGELFGAVKGAVMAFTRSLALSLAPGVRVNGVAPGWIQTAWGETAPPEWQDRVLRETPMRRWGLPEDVARAAAFLVGPSSGFLTGQILRVDGGAVR